MYYFKQEASKGPFCLNCCPTWRWKVLSLTWVNTTALLLFGMRTSLYAVFLDHFSDFLAKHQLFLEMLCSETPRGNDFSVRVYCLIQAMWSCVIKSMKTERLLWSISAGAEWVLVANTVSCCFTVQGDIAITGITGMICKRIFLCVCMFSGKYICTKCLEGRCYYGSIQLRSKQSFSFQMHSGNYLLCTEWMLKPDEEVMSLSFLCVISPPNLQKKHYFWQFSVWPLWWLTSTAFHSPLSNVVRKLI